MTFNRLVMIFNRKEIPRQGIFGGLIFRTSPDRHFWWMGLLSFFGGLILSLVSLGFSFGGWEIARLWLYLMASAMAILIGIQLIIYWILIRVLDEVSQREELTKLDLTL